MIPKNGLGEDPFARHMTKWDWGRKKKEADMSQMRSRLPQRDGARIRIRGTRFRRQTSVLV